MLYCLLFELSIELLYILITLKRWAFLWTNSSKLKNYYINSPSKIDIYKLHDNDICLIDNWNDKDVVRKINKLILVGNNKKAHFPRL